MMTLANKLTLLRLVLGLLTFGALWTRRPEGYSTALALYVAATVTDWVDGWVARRTDSMSPFGAMADPIADKVLVIGALIAAARVRSLDIPVWAVFLIIVRELVIGGLRTLAGAQGKVLAAERWGKWKMAIQSGSVIAILLLLVLDETMNLALPDWCDALPHRLVVLCLAVTWLSGALYLYQNRRLLQSSWSAPRPR